LSDVKTEPVRGEGWNVFQHVTDQALWCAVPPHRPIPGFLFSGRWLFSRHDIRSGNALPEFRDNIADHAVHLKGFYLFHRFEAEVLKAASDLESSGALGDE
jgi:hypothetical protein